jgi:hypothetical protein
MRKTKDSLHQYFLKQQEKEVIDIYLNNKGKRFDIYEELLNKNNIFYVRIFSSILHKHLTPDFLEDLRKRRISKTMEITPKTLIHNKRVSIGVKRAWKDGKFKNNQYTIAYYNGIKNRRSYAGKNNPMYGKPSPKGSGRGKGGIRKDIGHYVRSTWEANICRVLKYFNKNYDYEKHRFKISLNNIDYTYCPDLKINNTFWEIKGHAKSSKNWICFCKDCVRNRSTMEEVKNKYKIKIILIGNEEYNHFKNRFKKVIKGWEK